MKSVNIAELKNRLSQYLRDVRRGEPLLIRDRDRIIARIEPLRDPSAERDDESRRLAELESRGILRRGKGGITPAMFSRAPEVRIDAVGVLLKEREEGW